jgi:23S rRNA (guanosine2251-2'-O)-methyltransferase
MAALNARRRRFEVILISHGAHPQKLTDVIEAAERMGVPIKRVDRAELDAIAHGQTHGGVVALVGPKPRTTIGELLEILDAMREPPLLLLVEGVDDARNLGFTLRSAEALGVHAVLIKKHVWDFDPVEVARPASGAYERMPLVQIDDVSPIQQLQRRGLRLYGCIAGVKRTIYDADLAGPSILAIGGEKRGLSGAVRSICDRLVTIPTMGEGTSLPLSHAAAVAMAEAMRQKAEVRRRADPAPPPQDLAREGPASS